MGVVKFLLKPSVTKKHGSRFATGTLRINQTLHIFKCNWVKKVNLRYVHLYVTVNTTKKLSEFLLFFSLFHIWNQEGRTPTTGLFIMILTFVFNH